MQIEHCVVFGGMGDPPSASETVDVANIKIDVVRIKRTIVFMGLSFVAIGTEPVLEDTLCAFRRGLAACSKIERFVKSHDAVGYRANDALVVGLPTTSKAESGSSFCSCLTNESKTE